MIIIRLIGMGALLCVGYRHVLRTAPVLAGTFLWPMALAALSAGTGSRCQLKSATTAIR
jgi:hypothetical protein